MKRELMENKGTAIILSLIIVTVLFILISFLIRKVVTNTMMVRKAGEEQKSYALAKQGILYALDGLNKSNEAEEWPGNKNWLEIDLDNEDKDNDTTTGDKECRVRVDKDDLPPDIFLSDPNNDAPYITVESEDLPKKLITLQGIADYTSPLLKYVRFINSDTTFDDVNPDPSAKDMFGESGSGAICQGESPFYILGELTWGNGSSNNLVLTGNNKAIVCGRINPFDEATTRLEINGNLPDADHQYYTDLSNSVLFDTAEGRYFDLEHLPSSYDYSSGNSTFYYGGVRSPFWPQINEERYKNLASGVNCYLNNPDEINKEAEWSDPSNDNTANDNDTITEWLNDGEATTTSYHYYPYAPRLVLNNIDVTQELSDATVDIIDYSSITNNIIFAEGDVSVSGIIPSGKNLTIASAGNIFIDSNLLKEANSASLALLAKQDIVLNPTLRYGMDSGNTSITNESWHNHDNCLGNPDGYYTSPESGMSSFAPDEEKIYTLDIDLGRAITGGRIVLWNYQKANQDQLDTKLQVWVTREDPPPANSDSWDQEVLPFGDVPTGDSFNIDLTPRTFRWIRLNVRARNTDDDTHDFDLSEERLDATEIPFYGIDAALFAEGGNLKVVTGGGINQNETILPKNDAYKPLDTGGLKAPSDSGTSSRRLFFWGTLAQDEWTGASVAGWSYITYVYDSNLSSNPPPSLPPSVNLVSLRRKGED